MKGKRRIITSTYLKLTQNSARNRRIAERHRRRNDEAVLRQSFQKNGRHRFECRCPTCVIETRGCWNCGVAPSSINDPNINLRLGPMPRNWNQPQQFRQLPPVHPHHQRPGPPPGPPVERRICGMDVDDLRTWSINYSTCIKVYVCAERYCLTEFKSCIATYVINR